MADDQALLLAARAGDQRAFAALYRDHHRRAMHEARKVVSNRSDAEDCVAAAFASTFQAMRKGGGPTEAFRPYLLTAVRNSALQLVRLKRYGSEVATDELEPPAHVDLYEIGADPAVRNAFAGLPERWREVLWKTEIEGLAPRDLATELAMSANGVAALAKRARDGFRKAYLTEAVGPDPHPWAMERLDLYRDGALDPRTRDLVELHLENCARCQEALAPLPITAASIGVLLLAAGAVAPAAIAASAGGAAIGGSFLGGVRHLRPRWTTGPAKLASASAAAVAIVGTVLVVAISARDEDRGAAGTTVRPRASAAVTVATAVPPRAAPVVVPIARPSTSLANPTTAPTTEAPTTVAALATIVDVTDDPTTTRRRTTTTRGRVPATTTQPVTPSTEPATTPGTVAPTSAPTSATTQAPTTTIEATTTTADPTTTESTTTTTVRPPQYGGRLEFGINRPSYTVTVRATEPDGLPAGTTISLQFSSPAPWSVSFTGASNCAPVPSGNAGQIASVVCSTPALDQGSTAVVSFSTDGTEFVTVVVSAQRPGGLRVTQCDPSTACGRSGG